MSVLDAIDAEIKAEDDASKLAANEPPQKPVEEVEPPTGVLGLIDAEIEAEQNLVPFAGKKAEELDTTDYEVLNYLSPEKLTEVSNARRDIPLPEDLLRKKFDYQRSLPWNEGMRTMEDWYNIGAGVAETGVSFGKGVAKVVKNVLDPTGDKGFQSVKDFVSPTVELPSMAANLATKLYTGGMDWTDRLSEKFGLQDQERSFENYKARHLVDQIQAQAAQEDPSVYGRLIKSNFVKEGLAQIALSTIPDAETISEQEGVSLEEAKQIRKNRAYQVAEQTASERAAMEPKTDEDIATAGTFLLPSSLGLGEMGLVSLGAEAAFKAAPQIARGIKYAGKTDAQIKAINDAAQIAEREKALETLARRQQPSFVGKVAGATADKIDAATLALKNISEKTPQILKDVVPIVGGGAIGYGVTDENRGGGILAGALLGKAGRPLLKAAGYATKIPALVREIDAARAISAGGTKGTFEILGGTPNVSKEAAKILRYGGRRIDDILENSVEYAKAGIHGTTLALATGALESASPEELNNMLASGLFYIGGGRAAHHVFGKLTGADPVVEARKRRQQVQDDLKTYRDLDQASKDTLNSVTSWDNVIANRQRIAQQAEIAYNDAVARGSKDADKLGQNLKAQRTALSMLNRANVQTRNEYGRQFITQLTRNNQLINGVLRAGQNNVGISILTPKQIFDKFRQDPANAAATDQELMEAAEQRGFYSTPEGAVEYQAGMGMEAPKSKMIFDRTKPSIVINADHLKARMLIDGESAAEVLNHEVGHHVRNIPEFRDANKDAEAMLFSQEIRDPSGNVVATTSGRYSPKDLVEMYKNNYMKGKSPDEIEQLSRLAGLWDFSRNELNENAVASYMRDEIVADLNAETLSRHLGEDLDSGTKHIIDLARVKTKKNILDRAIIKFAGLGGKGDPTSELTGAEYSPEIMAANRNAMRALQSLQGEVSAAVKALDEPKISRAEMMRNKALMERYGKYSGLFKTRIQAQIFDGNGNPVGAPIDIANPNAAEGSWQNKDGQVRQLNGYGQRPDEVSEANGIVIPDGGSLVVGRQIVMQPDGKTPVLLDAKEAKKLQKDRGRILRDALNTPDEGAINRFEPTGDPDGTWRGTLTPLQIEAIKNLPEGIVPKSIKEHILKINDMIVRGDGSRMLVDYAAVMNDNGKYTPYSAKIYDVVPIGMHLSKDGHFLVTTISVGRMFDKLNNWSERMPARLAPWGGSKDAFFKEFTEKYLQNWQNGLAGETGLAGTPAEAMAKKNIFNDFLNLATKDTAPLNPDRTKTPRRRGDVRGKDIDRTIMSMRLDHMTELIDNDSAPKVPVSYQKAKFNMMPAEPAPEAPMEERRPSAINLGISATYTAERRPFEARYVAPEGAALTASLVSSGTSLESFGKESLAKLAEYYGIAIPDGASRGEIIDSINEREPSAGISFMPAEEKYPTGERGFYSGLQKTIDEKMPAKASPQQILSIVNNPQNAKADEVKWSNIAGFVEGKDSVTKQEVLDYLRNEGSVKFEEVTEGLTPKQQDLLKRLKAQKIQIASELMGTQDKLLKWSGGTSPDNPKFDLLRRQLSETSKRIESLETKRGGYTTYVFPNGENYREVVLTMPYDFSKSQSRMDELNKKYNDFMEGIDPVAMLKLKESDPDAYKKLEDEMKALDDQRKQLQNDFKSGKTGEQYTSSHFSDIPNYVAHMRLNERQDSTGADGLFIEEIQSDRHQQGREKGYRGDFDLKRFQELGTKFDRGEASQTELAELDSLATQQRRGDSDKIPDAPFRKDWSVQMFKRALRDAIASGKEWIGWTDGATQADRFDISKQVDEIRYFPDEGYGTDKYLRLEMDLSNGGRHMLSVNKETGNTVSGVGPAEWSGKALADIIGKETADKILSGKGEEKSRVPQELGRTSTTPVKYKSLSGEGLKIGGEGMKGFYDNILPKEIGKYVKKWGGKVEEGKIGQSISKEEMDMGDISDATPEELAQLEAQGMVAGPFVKIWKVEITPEMRESIQKGGQLAFMPKVAVVPERFTGTGEEKTRRGKYVAPPKFFGQFNISQYEKGGKFFDAETGEDITDRSYENASISVEGGKPSLLANNESEEAGTGPIIRSNLFKQKAGWKWISENPPETSTIVSVEGQGKHVYTMRADFQNGVKMARYPDKASEPRLRPTGRGELIMGQEIGRIDIRGKEHPVYDTITIGEKPASDISFMPAAGESKPVPTQEELDAMKARLPKYTAKGYAHNFYGQESHKIDILNDKGEVVSYGIVHLDEYYDRILVVDGIETIKKFQNQGYGQALYREIAKYAQENGLSDLYSSSVSPDAQKRREQLFESEKELDERDIAVMSSRIPSDISFMPAAKLDEAHAKAIESGDMKEAQRMVDEKARQAGYKTNKLYHGTIGDIDIPEGDLGVAAHLSRNREIAQRYANSRFKQDENNRSPEEKAIPEKVHEWYVRGEIFDPLNDLHLDRVNQGSIALDKSEWNHANYEFFEKPDVQRAIKDAGFDGYEDREGYGDAWHENLAIFDPNNIKSADPATYDDNGKLIPLSQRFDTSKPDIRFMPKSEEQKETKGQKKRSFDVVPNSFQKLVSAGYTNQFDYKGVSKPFELPIADLNPTERVNEEAVQLLVDKMDNGGTFTPIVIDENNNIVDGHHRVEAASQMGIDRVPVQQLIRSSLSFMPYSPELPKTEDGKVDWKGFKTKTQEIAKPLAALAPLGGFRFMPSKPIAKNEDLPEFEKTIIRGTTPINGFKWDKATNVEIDIGDGRKMSFSFDPEYLEIPEFKDLIEELKGEAVILLEADRQRATGGDMGGPLHPFLKSNQVTVVGPDGIEYKAVWANMTSTFVSGAKNRLAAHGAKYAVVHLMDSIAHKSNKRTARTLDKLMRESNLDEFQKEIISLSMQAGIIAGQKSAISSSITALKRKINQAGGDKEIIAKINKKIVELQNERNALTPKGLDADIFSKISSIKTAQSNVNTGNWKQSSLDNAVKNLKEYRSSKEYKALLKKNKSLYISDNIGSTFSDRGSAIEGILSFKFDKFDPSRVMRETSDFREGENLDIVTVVELSKNPDMFALYFGKDPKEEAAMSPAERKARDEMRANPNFVEHEAYDWVMLGPKNGNNFLVKKPMKPEEVFKDYREVHSGKTVVNGSPETVAGAMRKNAQFKLRVGEKVERVESADKTKKKTK